MSFTENSLAAAPSLTLEQALRTVEQYRTLFYASRTGAWEYHIDTDFLECNEVYFSLLGHNPNDFGGVDQQNLKNRWIDLLHPDDAAPAQQRFKEYIAHPHGLYEGAFRMRHADGSWVWIFSRGNLMLDQNGNLTDKVIGTHVDITAQKKAEEEIMRERILLRTLIDNLPDTIYIKDAEGRKVIANKADVFTLGAATEAEVIGKTDLELFNNEIGERGYRDDMEVLRTGVPMLSKEEFFFDKQGNKNWLLTTKVPVRDDKGEVTRILGIGRNITHRKQTEDALNDLNQQLKLKSEKLSKQAEDLKALNEQIIQQKEQELEKAIAQGKFEIASEVLHDIGNALVGFGSHLNRINRVLERGNLDPIKNVALFLKSQYEAISGAIGNDKAAALLKITEGFLKAQSDNQTEIGSAISELIHIISHIQEILSIQRQLVRGHGGTHERKPVNLVSIIEDCRSMLFASFEKRGVQFKADIKPGNYVIKGDHTKLMQVFLNIIKNSLEAMPMDRPERKIQISLESVDEKITLKITDNGDGFDEATRQRMFARGFTTKQSGTGLGLYNCRSIIESHVGSLEITSEGPGLGATSTIIFNN